MNNQRIWYIDVFKQYNCLYFFDLGFNEDNDFSYQFLLQKIKKEDRTEEQRMQIHAYAKKSSERRKLHQAHHSIDENLLPATMYVTFEFDRMVVLPNFFAISEEYLIMSEDFANILKSFNMGTNQILPIRFFDLVNQEYVNETTYYLLNVTEKHRYFLPKLTQPEPYFVYNKDGFDIYQPAPNKERHASYVYSSKALDCSVDLWYDPSFLNELYVSDKLKQALQDSGFGGILDLWECQLADV